MPKEKVNIVSAVPYQLCPKCNGQGQVSMPPYVAGDVRDVMSTGGIFQCDVCNGNKVIPMFIIKTN
jgi:DnaJ-class molecular chaperone